MKIFGFEITKRLGKETDDDKALQTFALPVDNDGAAYVNAANSAAGYYGQILDIDGGSLNNEKDLILRYRASAVQPECDAAITEIVNGAIISDSDGAPVNLILDNVDLADNIKKKIHDEFNNVLQLLDFTYTGFDLFRRWYIDGRIYFYMIMDPKKPKDGIKEIQQIDPLKIKKIKEVSTRIDRVTGIKTSEITDEYFMYTDDFNTNAGMHGLKIDPNAIVYVPSGVLDENGKVSISHLHKAVKLVNQLRMMEDALVIYRIARAPERRIFYIDIGNLPKGKAEEYVQGIMAKYRNKLMYDANTGEIRDDRKTMSMLEDFWLPRREGGRGTEITTLPGGENLSQIEDVIYFKKNLYKSLNVPSSRLESETMFNVGRSTEISREEVKFQKFINRLRRQFSTLFIDMLRVQLILKGIITQNDWPAIRSKCSVDYIEDNFFSELKDFEIMKERLGMLDTISGQIGKYYSEKWVRSNILNQSDDEVEKMNEQIKLEADFADTVADDENGASDKDFTGNENNLDIDNTHKEEIHEAQLKMIESMTKILEE
jgi:hypothetical protein